MLEIIALLLALGAVALFVGMTWLLLDGGFVAALLVASAALLLLRGATEVARVAGYVARHER